MWQARLNNDLAALDKCIVSASFPTYVAEVDATCSRHAADAAEHMGETAAQLFLLKTANLVIAKYEFINRHITLISHPVGMLIDPSNGCGLACPGCVHSGLQKFWDWPSGLLKVPMFQSFLDLHGPFAIEVYLANYGEPLLSAQTPRLVQIARSYGLPTFTSSSLSVPGKLMDGVVESGLNFMIVSIDGATSDTYLKYRRGGDFAQAIANLRTLVAAKRRLNSYTPVLHWQFLVFEHNRHEVDQVTELAREIGVNQIALARPFTVDWDDRSIQACEDWQTRTIIFDHDRQASMASLGRMRDGLDAERIASAHAVSWTERLAARVPTEAERRRSPGPHTGPRPCNWLYKSLTMDARGRVMPCARPPTKSGNLVFSSNDAPDHFNSSQHRLARQIFVDEAVYTEQVASSAMPPPYCAQCEHRDQKADIDTHETVRRLLHDIDLYEPLDDARKFALTDW